jgi:hypothetical protein
MFHRNEDGQIAWQATPTRTARSAEVRRTKASLVTLTHFLITEYEDDCRMDCLGMLLYGNLLGSRTKLV